MTVWLMTIVVLAVVMVAMAVGVLLANRPLRGSCGGTALLGPDGTPLTCSNCNCRLPEEAEADAVG